MHSRYDPNWHPKEAARLVSILGLNDSDLARYFEVEPTTIPHWNKRHPEFKAAVSKARVEVDMRVATSLYQSAVGFEYTEDTAVKVKDADGNESVKVVSLNKKVPPNPTSAARWLEMRRPETWSPKEQRKKGDALDALLGYIAESSKDNVLPSQNALESPSES